MSRHITDYSINMGASPAPGWGYSVFYNNPMIGEHSFVRSGSCKDYDTASECALKAVQDDIKKYRGL